MGFVHTFAHYFRFFSNFFVIFQTFFYENVYVVMANAKKSGHTKSISIEFDLP